MLQSTASFQPFSSLKRNGRGRKGGEANGWASEEVTEEMGEFDFENNLAKFDKRTIFDQMRKEDQVDDASRLVSHNRRPKPGTNNGKNLHYSENVLDLPANIAKNTDFWNSEADDLNGHNGQQGLNGQNGHDPRMTNSRRAESKNGPSRRSQSRKASAAMAGSQPLSRVNSAVSTYPSQVIRVCELLLGMLVVLTPFLASTSVRPLPATFKSPHRVNISSSDDQS
jgi:enhancer of mRNA-decapping protein 3